MREIVGMCHDGDVYQSVSDEERERSRAVSEEVFVYSSWIPLDAAQEFRHSP